MRLILALLLACWSLLAHGQTLSWTPPTQNEDGTPLTDLAGYRIYYGQTSALGQMLALTDPGLTAHTFDGLASGTWYFAMTALNTAGSESARTQTVSTTVVAPAPPPAPAWVVAPTTSGTRPVYEAVLKVDGSGLKRGNREGTIVTGKPCGAEVFARLRYSYRDVTESDVTLTSPTYRGRHHVAICVAQ